MNEVRTLGMGCLRTQSSLVLGPWLSTKNDAGQHKNSLLGFPYLHGKLGHVVHKAHLSLGTERPGHLSNLGWPVNAWVLGNQIQWSWPWLWGTC